MLSDEATAGSRALVVMHEEVTYVAITHLSFSGALIVSLAGRNPGVR